MNCRVCRGAVEHLGQDVVLGRHDAEYVRCKDCGSVAVVDPTWLDEAYMDAIASTDVGLVSRCVSTATCVAVLARTARLNGPVLDYGAGEGLMVRLLRNRGLDFRWFDPMAHNRYAVGLEAEPGQHCSMITAVEVVEHLLDPVQTLRELAEAGDVLFLSTYLVPEPAPPPGTWWYYSPETGQHITFLSERGLRRVAEELGLHLASRGNLHVLSRRRLPLRSQFLSLRPRLAAIWADLHRWPTLTPGDHTDAVERRN